MNFPSSGELAGQRLREIRATTDAASVDLVLDRNRDGAIDANETVIATVQPTDGIASIVVDELLLPGLKGRRPDVWICRHRYKQINQ